MVGVGFPERNDSFDFVAALTEYNKQVRIAKGLDKETIKTSGKDYSLKEGETFSLDIGGLIG